MSCFNFSDNEIETAIGRIKQNMEVLVRMTEEDKKLIINHVAKFIKSNNDVIVYGGYAQNLLSKVLAGTVDLIVKSLSVA